MKRIKLFAVQLMLLMVLIALALSSCAPVPPPVMTRIQVERVTLPPALLTCPPAPAVPVTNLQSVVARYIVALWQAGQVCRDDVASIANIAAAPVPK
ncbi:MAG: hypothetical protein B7Z80_18110 [Rhodospirillales bacterium 20-64-7]|nr:MAG: hypothetical protein B7Z80_18110 [Rhodospirillales bacterium 20-64-7]